MERRVLVARAVAVERADPDERVDCAERTEGRERVDSPERTEGRERVVVSERTETPERVGQAERAEVDERLARREVANNRRLRFVEEMMVDGNATQAALRAGYSPRTAFAQGSALLSIPAIRAAVAAKRGHLAARNRRTADGVLEELAVIAFSDIGEILDMSGEQPKLRAMRDIPERARRAIAKIKVKRALEGTGKDAREVEITEFSLWSKTDALEKLAKHFGLLVERIQVNDVTGEAPEYVADWGASKVVDITVTEEETP